MAIPSFNGVFDTSLQKIQTTNGSTWADLGPGDSAGANTIQSWADWTNWTPAPVSPLTWVTETIDLGETAYFNLTWNITCVGTPTFTVYTSTTGAFAGEETSTTVNRDDTDIEAFYGQYVALYISVAQDAGGPPPEISAFDWVASGNRFDIIQFDINSADLLGSSNARQIAMPRTVSKVLQMNLTAHTSSYVEDSYVASDYIQDASPGFPSIVSKTRTAPEVTFVSTSGTRVDAIFDITMNVLPEQFMDGDNLTVR